MDKKKADEVPLHVVHVDKVATTINRAHLIFHSILVALFLFYRLGSILLDQNDAVSYTHLPILPCLCLFGAEVVLTFIWLLEQATRWRLVDRTAFIERLPEESQLPDLDVLICTADPDREPTFQVMNTVVSAMALDYPSDKLNVYLSDDSGSSLTLSAMKEAWLFATWWVPFCTRYGVQSSSPMAYFEDQITSPTPHDTNADIAGERLFLKEKYDLFKERLEVNAFHGRRETDKNNKTNHPPLVQVIDESCTDNSLMNPDYSHIPSLVYVAREKRPSHSHHFKAGALNALLRVSGLLSNSPIVLVLDCDMYCNDPTSAKQAMCFYVDPHISPSLGFVQFPQRFYNLSQHAIYDGDFRWAFKVVLRGMDGLGTGPFICGTGFYLNRNAICNRCVKGQDLVEMRKAIGPSNEFIKTLSRDIISNEAKLGEMQNLKQEAEFVASCSYEEETKWGDGLGFYYYSVAKDAFTSYNLQIRGWKSVYLDPKKASFLGRSTTNLNDLMIQNTRWSVGLIEIGISEYCPLLYGPSTKALSLLHRCCLAFFYLHPMNYVSGWCLAVVPQICLIHNIPIYPKTSISLFPWLATLIFLSSQIKNLYEVHATGGTTATWWNEMRIWIMKMLTCHTYGCIDAILKVRGLKTTSFIPANKVVDEDQEKRYQQGQHDFQTSIVFLVPLGTTTILNLVSFIVGLYRMMVLGQWNDEMAVQVLLAGFFVIMSKPVIEGMILRKDKGRFPASATLCSIISCLVLLLVAPIVLFHLLEFYYHVISF